MKNLIDAIKQACIAGIERYKYARNMQSGGFESGCGSYEFMFLKTKQNKRPSKMKNLIDAIWQSWIAAIERYRYIRHLQNGGNPDIF